MEFKPAKCPNCGGELQLPMEQAKVMCMYCGTDIVVSEAVSAMAGINLNALREMALVSYESKNYKESMKKWEQILSIDSKNAEAWLYKGLCLFHIANSFLDGKKIIKLILEQLKGNF